ncbi:hypothetical protein CSC2_16520 [Clostridium zeae]|uniref:Uncharacterized protein n=1 Tax=Clostridium zeae TaxID=2759022 RepID=A0ABQ1E8L3_9CLOT|nr:HAD hydrolase family protein [Clostridium zeae]GFZ31126.1 hypothetical protein CSC2_16520 [Clostridium zeae]
MKKGCDKSTGVGKLAQILGITKEEIIEIGDAVNDIGMIGYAGLGVTIGNAQENIKEIGGFVTKSNEEDGVAHVIEKFILSE